MSTLGPIFIPAWPQVLRPGLPFVRECDLKHPKRRRLFMHADERHTYFVGPEWDSSGRTSKPVFIDLCSPDVHDAVLRAAFATALPQEAEQDVCPRFSEHGDGLTAWSLIGDFHRRVLFAPNDGDVHVPALTKSMPYREALAACVVALVDHYAKVRR